MTYPKWRHHPTLKSLIVYDRNQEESQAPTSEGWRDDRQFEKVEPPKNKGGRPRKETS